MTHSLLRDDALWQEALLWGEEGDTGTACERLETLVDHFPDSRYVPCAAARCPLHHTRSGEQGPSHLPPGHRERSHPPSSKRRTLRAVVMNRR